MDNITIRKGRPEDADDFAELALFTGPELHPALYGSESNLRKVMKGSFQHVRNAFSYEHSRFIEANGEIAGMSLVFTHDQMRREQLRSGVFILRYLKLTITLSYTCQATILSYSGGFFKTLPLNYSKLLELHPDIYIALELELTGHKCLLSG